MMTARNRSSEPSGKHSSMPDLFLGGACLCLCFFYPDSVLGTQHLTCPQALQHTHRVVPHLDLGPATQTYMTTASVAGQPLPNTEASETKVCPAGWQSAFYASVKPQLCRHAKPSTSPRLQSRESPAIGRFVQQYNVFSTHMLKSKHLSCLRVQEAR